jgi:hypothetical protein
MDSLHVCVLTWLCVSSLEVVQQLVSGLVKVVSQGRVVEVIQEQRVDGRLASDHRLISSTSSPPLPHHTLLHPTITTHNHHL